MAKRSIVFIISRSDGVKECYITDSVIFSRLPEGNYVDTTFITEDMFNKMVVDIEKAIKTPFSRKFSTEASEDMTDTVYNFGACMEKFEGDPTDYSTIYINYEL